jgi:ribokinase
MSGQEGVQRLRRLGPAAGRGAGRAHLHRRGRCGRHPGDAVAFYRVPAAPAKTVDTTGAGDAFNGALGASLAKYPQRAFAKHVRFATRYAALSTERQGAALAMPKYEAVVARFGPR